MKMRKNKGKIHPSPSQSPSSSSNPPPNSQNALSILTLLPAAILALISVLSIEDREVFAYMVTRSMNSVNPTSSIAEGKKTKNNNNSSSSKKLLGTGSSVVVHRAPVFDCECFDCYRSYWFRWDSSPDKELIHKAIEEFEEYLFSQEQGKRSGKGKRRERIGRRGGEKAKVEEREEVFEEREEVFEEVFVVGVVENEGGEEEAPAAEEEAVTTATAVGESYNKGLVRKVLPDVVGLLNSRLWGLWSPNV